MTVDRHLLRILIIVIAVAQLAAGAWLGYTTLSSQSDAAGEAMSNAFSLMFMTAAVIFAGPALALALANQVLILALGLALTAPVVWYALSWFIGEI